MGCAQSSKVVTKEEREQAMAEAARQNREYATTMAFLSQVPLLKRLPQDQHPLLAAACVPVLFEPGKNVIVQGDRGAEFFVILAGEASVKVSKDGAPAAQVATLKTGDYFGENALLSDEPRTATIVASSPLSTLRITREKFQELGLHNHLQFANRRAVGAGNQKKTAVMKPPTPKTEAEISFIAQAVRNNSNLQEILKDALNEKRTRQMADTAWKEEVTAGKSVITEGDTEADCFYVVASGSFDIFARPQGSDDDPEAKVGATKRVGSVSAGGSFGELALLYFVPRAATVTATTDATLWVMGREKFKGILMKASEEKTDMYVKFLERSELLAPLLAEERKAMAEAMVEMEFSRDDIVLEQGAVGNSLFVLYEGEVKVIKDGTVMCSLTASVSDGSVQLFGERALLNNEPRAATVKVASEAAKVLVMDRESFDMLLGPLQDIISRKNGRASTHRAAGASGTPNANREKIFKKDLTRVGLLGSGAFGVVELWAHRSTESVYALKAVGKGHILESGLQDSMYNEKKIMFMLNSPFIIKLHETYNGTRAVYFLLEAALGGELYSTYNRKGLYGSETHAKFYIASVILAFQHCHERRVIYRDLKPENLLLTADGYLKLTDMGLSKVVIGKTFTTCGTPEYFAPEVITSAGHTVAVDWWASGILLFELLTSFPPFEADSPMQVFVKVMRGIEKIPFPASCQGQAKKLIVELLKPEPSQRLPMRPKGMQSMKEGGWYKGFDWSQLASQTLEVPYKPTVRSKVDLSNFSAKHSLPPHVEFEDDGSGWDKEFASA